MPSPRASDAAMTGSARRFRAAFVTGGAGFIGVRLYPHLAALCDRVTIYDNLLEQVHGADAAPPAALGEATFVRGDVRDAARLRGAVADADPDLVVHLAAETGTGQSYDTVSRYCDVNVGGAAHLAEALRALEPDRRRRVVLASSRAVYGEGAWRDADGRMVVPNPRSVADMAAGRFAPRGPDGAALTPIPTPEDAPPAPASIYASTKLMQEYVLRQALDGTAAELVVLRFQNVYGPGQSLKNPYTGVLSIFSQLIRDGHGLDIYEDGDIVRDFVHVHDVARAIAAAAAVVPPPAGPVNIGAGVGSTILEVALELARLYGRSAHAVSISGKFRNGDVRYAVADTARAAAVLGWRAEIPWRDGLAGFAAQCERDWADAAAATTN